ncbi:hypothetical protein ACFLZY_03065 [Patescibacteria group bacterium]
MKHFIKGSLPETARNLMRQIGYSEHIGHQGQISFSRRLSSDKFPRFHAYVEEQENGMQINLHIDQKQQGASSGTAHGGEYEGSLVENEMKQIIGSIIKFSQTPQPTAAQPKKKSKGFWGGFLGS